jgi:hypothetical protein
MKLSLKKIETEHLEDVSKVLCGTLWKLCDLCVSSYFFVTQRATEKTQSNTEKELHHLMTFETYSIIILVSAIMFSLSCSNDHLIIDSQYLASTERAYLQKKQLASGRDSTLFSVFNQNLSLKQSEALKFLFAYMPLSDLADYDGNFFLANINMSLRTLSETSWGKNIPGDIFLHYVLPCRVNNENLDSFRIVYYDELMKRVKGKDISDAALEINHWCHEKVSYQSADLRTSSPINTILSARGRCGEESTFTVAALRTVGIPARQVYTPRWAHTDDNHAWVEIWVNGKWFYMGACEPEPVLDRGWFTEPVRRAMLVHTKSFGASTGQENAINSYGNYTDVNNLGKYAVTKKITVKVTGRHYEPVAGAEVEYQLYNYAEFYPLAVVPTNENGISQFETGLGDLMIWAHKGDDFEFKKISVGETDTLSLNITSEHRSIYSLDLDLDVPVVRSPLPGPSKELMGENAERINRENEIRQKYIDSWIHPAEVKTLALNLNLDSVAVRKEIGRSMGNYREILTFLSGTPDSMRTLALSLLEILPDKDLRDVSAPILSEHLRNIRLPLIPTGQTWNKMFLEYVLNPRVANEKLVPWRHYFLNNLPSQIVLKGGNEPSLIVKYLNDNIRIDNDENYYQTPLTPEGVNEIKVSDGQSRAICFVAICRSLGLPSRLEPGRNVPQYFLNGSWTDVYFSDQKAPDLNKGYIRFQSSDTKPVPEYYIHFTLARFEGGRYNTLEYDYNKKITDFKDELPLPPGHYMLVTGNRISDSKILSDISFFDLSENEHKILEIRIRKDMSEKKILGSIDVNKTRLLYHSGSTSQECAKDKGMVIIWIDPEKEPAKHILNDLPLLKTELDAWGGKFLFLTGEADNSHTMQTDKLKDLPVNTSIGIDNKLDFLRNSVRLNVTADLNLPVVIVTDNAGNILFISTGYRVGIGEQILKYINN